MRRTAGSVDSWPLAFAVPQILGGLALAVDAAMVDAANGGPPLGAPRVTLTPWGYVRRRVSWGPGEGKSGLPSGVLTA